MLGANLAAASAKPVSYKGRKIKVTAPDGTVYRYPWLHDRKPSESDIAWARADAERRYNEAQATRPADPYKIDETLPKQAPSAAVGAMVGRAVGAGTHAREARPGQWMDELDLNTELKKAAKGTTEDEKAVHKGLRSLTGQGKFDYKTINAAREALNRIAVEKATENAIVNTLSKIENASPSMTKLLGSKGLTGHVAGAVGGTIAAPADVAMRAASVVAPGATPMQRVEDAAVGVLTAAAPAIVSRLGKGLSKIVQGRRYAKAAKSGPGFDLPKKGLPSEEGLVVTFRPNTHTANMSPNKRAEFKASGREMTTEENFGEHLRASIEAIRGNNALRPDAMTAANAVDDAIKAVPEGPQREGVGGALRSFLSMGDISAPLTQGGVMAFTNPGHWLKSFGGSIVDAFVKDVPFKARMEELAKTPRWKQIYTSGVDLPALRGGDAEFFFDSKMDDLWGLGAVKKGSQQAYDGFLTRARILLMDSFIEQWEKGGKTIDDKGLKLLGEAVETLTGRATGKGGEAVRALPAAGRTFFAPSWWLSQFQLMTGKPLRNAVSHARKTGEWAPVKIMAKQYAKLGAVATGTLVAVDEALALADSEWRVERDPRSSLFGKAYRYDSKTGKLISVDLLPPQMAGPLKTFMWISPFGELDNATGEVEAGSYQRATNIGQLVEGKTAPLPKLGFNVSDSIVTSNKRAANPKSTAKYPFDKNMDPRQLEGWGNLGLGALPIGWQQAIEGSGLDGWEKLFVVTSLFGRGANAYTAKPPKRDPRKSFVKGILGP